MALAQLQAVTGRRIKPKYRDIIEAQVPYLLDRYRIKKENELTQQGLDLQAKGLEQNTALAREALDEEKKQARRSNLIALGNLGLQTGLGAYSVFSDKTPEAPIISPKTTDIAQKTTAITPDLGFTSSETGGSTAVPFLSKSGILDTSKWKGAFTEPSTYGGAGIGTLAARTIGKDKSTLTKALIGAGAGGLASAAFSGGSPYESVVGAVLGGLGGIF